MPVKKKKKPTTKKKASAYNIMDTPTTPQTPEQVAAAKASGPEVIDLPLTVIPPIEGSTVKEGTAQIEPQFICYRYGHKFVTAQTFKDLHKGLLQAEELEEQIVEIDFTMDGYPLDCIVQVNRAIEEIYGFSHAKERMTFWGPIPPKRLNIKTSLTESVQVVYGEMAPPAWEGGSLNMHVDMANPLCLAITGQVKRKFEPAVKGIVQLAGKKLKANSIYQGNAVELDLNYVVTGEFNPAHCAPQFVDVTQEINLILTKKIERQLYTHLWNVIRKPHNFREDGVAIKTGILLQGEPGTGKTLTAYRTAQVAIESKWTYLYLRTPITTETFLTGYKMAQLYGPSVYFVEDCDMLFGKDRDEKMNSLLETLDGITAKNAEVITIFTTNYPKKLNKAFVRSGRVNQEITLTAPDAEAAGRFVDMMLGEFKAPDVDLVAVGTAFANLVQSDIKNGCDIAKKYHRGDSDDSILGCVNTEDLLLASEEVWDKVRGHNDEVDPKAAKLELIQKGVTAIMGQAMEGIEIVGQRVEKLEGDFKKVAAGVGVKLK